jgi:hypothetical protein
MTNDKEPATIPVIQSRYNRSTRDHWTHFAPHREQIEGLLLAGREQLGGRLCVLGAGNCNDLNLPKLIEAVDEIHLVDLDSPGLRAALDRQGVAASRRIYLHAPVDVTGVTCEVGVRPDSRVDYIDEVVRKAQSAPLPDLPGGFDIVLSSCVLSQIVGYANDWLGRSHPRAAALRHALRDRHLQLMIDLLAPGGSGILVSDFLSSSRREELPSVSPDALMGLMQKVIHDGTAFDGLSPALIESVLRHDPRMAPLLADVQSLRPWRWKLGPLKTFLVSAIRFRRSQGVSLMYSPARGFL